jgi:hypothetical protein
VPWPYIAPRIRIRPRRALTVAPLRAGFPRRAPRGTSRTCQCVVEPPKVADQPVPEQPSADAEAAPSDLKQAWSRNPGAKRPTHTEKSNRLRPGPIPIPGGVGSSNIRATAARSHGSPTDDRSRLITERRQRRLSQIETPASRLIRAVLGRKLDNPRAIVCKRIAARCVLRMRQLWLTKVPKHFYRCR